MKKIVLIISILLLITGCSNNKSKNKSSISNQKNETNNQSEKQRESQLVLNKKYVENNNTVGNYYDAVAAMEEHNNDSEAVMYTGEITSVPITYLVFNDDNTVTYHYSNCGCYGDATKHYEIKYQDNKEYIKITDGAFFPWEDNSDIDLLVIDSNKIEYADKESNASIGCDGRNSTQFDLLNE